MTRDNIICFRTSEELRKALERISRSERRSLSSTIENILYVYLEQREPKMPREDKRRYPRKKISSPALVSTRDGEIHAGTVHDMSLGGVNILLPPTFQCEIGDDSRLYVVFTRQYRVHPPLPPCGRPGEYRGLFYQYRLSVLPGPQKPPHPVTAAAGRAGRSEKMPLAFGPFPEITPIALTNLDKKPTTTLGEHCAGSGQREP